MLTSSRSDVPDDNSDQIPHEYPRVFESQGERIIVSLSSGHVDLILKLAERLTPPFGILYVLVVPRGADPGRYQLSRTLDFAELSQFMNLYRAFLEGDARHDIWVHSVPDDATIVYDRHEVLYVYGKQQLFEQLLSAEGFTPGTVEIPYPHFHNYLKEFDADQNSIVEWHEFVRSPLAASDEE